MSRFFDSSTVDVEGKMFDKKVELEPDITQLNVHYIILFLFYWWKISL